MKNIYLILTLILSACMQKSTIPKATKKPYEMTEHGNTRIDNYYWMRLTDEQKSRFAMRQKQILIAKKSGKKHIFQKEY